MEALHESFGLLRELGVTLPTPAYLLGLLIFGIAGIVFWVLGRRKRIRAVTWMGLALMLYPYVVWDTAALYGVGILLTIAATVFWSRGGRAAG